MAAASEAYPIEICELHQVSVDELDRLLDEEIDVWARDLSWDFAPSAALVRRFVQSQALTGFAVRVRGELIGYAYQVCDERKGLIGDFYVRPTAHSPSNEMALIGAVVESLMKTPGVRRIESQLMLLRTPLNAPLPSPNLVTRHDRFFMEIGREEIERLPFRELTHRVTIQPWNDRMHEDAAHVISAAYRGHVDSEINDQYRNIPGARRFVTNIVRFPGCGTFSVQGSCVAVDENSGRLCGVCLTSAVSGTTGHITQVCVLPGIRGSHIGYGLLRASLMKLIGMGYTTVSLTVTCTNVDAVRLYESLGFRIRFTFPALVWEDF